MSLHIVMLDPSKGSPPRRLNQNAVKWLAAGLMVVDHIGVVFFPQTLLLRYLGRLSFPLFSWLLGQGEQHTRNVYRYGLRLLAFGLLSQPIYSALFNAYQLNVLFTLLVGLITLRLGRLFPQIHYLIWPLGVLVAALIPMDGSGYGVAIMLLLAQPITVRWWVAWVALHGLLAASGGVLPMQLWAIPAPLIVMVASSAGQSVPPAKTHPEKLEPEPPKPGGFRARWFYWFYPGHLLMLWLFRQMA